METTTHVLWLFLCLICCVAAARGQTGAAKPDYCRPDLPGCCPKVVDHVMLLHIEKTGGTSLRTFLQTAVKRRFPKRSTICNYLKQMPYQCTPSSAEGGDPTCNAKNYAYYNSTLASGQHFKKGCKLTSSHHDYRIVAAIPPQYRNTTLLIVNLREPAERAVSHFYMLRRHEDPLALNTSVDAYFIRHPEGQSIARNRMTRVLAGDFCCQAGSPVKYDTPALLQSALGHLDEFCVVGLTSRVLDTMVYVQHVLGQAGDKPPKEIHWHNNAGKYQPIDQELVRQLRTANKHDVTLYNAAAARFEAQMKAIGRAGQAGEGDGGR